MDIVSRISQVLVYFLPALALLIIVFFLVKRFLDNSYRIRLLELRRSIQKETLPVKMQAYERLCLFLERISPNNILVRVNKPGMSARQLQTELLSTIRAEYEHNLSQQIYVSSAAWESIKNAKEDTIRLVNSAATSVGERASGVDLSKSIFEIMVKSERIPSQKALEILKREVRDVI